MRIWSIHPKYLDTKRLTAQWREALLCRNVLEDKTKGYKNHPQFIRIKNHNQPIEFINSFLLTIWEEANSRSFKYDKSKIDLNKVVSLNDKMEVTDKQLEYEYYHMMLKSNQLSNLPIKDIKSNPIFTITEGDIMIYEKVKEETLKIYG